ncbi:hypothetical protein D5R81_18285 [Parashewanella spongiae]|uniref:Uncharacterized protein n=1 Tax=Parashewanella spongiae TaxID=342950 RepID=A0A3A6TGJ5_9GAMM|nr:hypothetical protein [Parashewanella spongiae]MCL1079975.1 hypothetical protein [Parashewanella spongiae]RJY05992.1 hypothetical protein D5R81_18285 [Parashewanella spongiae]
MSLSLESAIPNTYLFERKNLNPSQSQMSVTTHYPTIRDFIKSDEFQSINSKLKQDIQTLRTYFLDEFPNENYIASIFTHFEVCVLESARVVSEKLFKEIYRQLPSLLENLTTILTSADFKQLPLELRKKMAVMLVPFCMEPERESDHVYFKKIFKQFSSIISLMKSESCQARLLIHKYETDQEVSSFMKLAMKFNRRDLIKILILEPKTTVDKRIYLRNESEIDTIFFTESPDTKGVDQNVHTNIGCLLNAIENVFPNEPDLVFPLKQLLSRAYTPPKRMSLDAFKCLYQQFPVALSTIALLISTIDESTPLLHLKIALIQLIPEEQYDLTRILTDFSSAIKWLKAISKEDSPIPTIHNDLNENSTALEIASKLQKLNLCLILDKELHKKVGYKELSSKTSGLGSDSTSELEPLPTSRVWCRCTIL